MRTGAALIGLLALPAWGAYAADYAFAPDMGEGDHTIAFEIPAPASWPQGAEVRVAFDWKSSEAYHVAAMTRDSAWLEEVAGGQPRRLGPAGAWPAVKGQAKISVKRRAWEMEVLCNGRTVARGCDESPFGGKVGVAVSGVNLSPDDLVVQPVEPTRLTDDFMRGPGEQNLWQIGSGNWQTVGIVGGKGQLRPDLSANPFSYRCNGTGPQLATVGDWFWDSYAATVAVKATQPNGAIGLAFYVQDPLNYYLLGLASAARPDSTQLQLTRVVDGARHVLDATTGGYEKDLWYRLTARVSNGVIEGWVDGVPRLSVYDATFGQGGIGLWAQDAGDGWFDDVTVEPWWAFSDPFASPDLSCWLQEGGQWEAGSGALRATSSWERPAGILVGPTSWKGYEVAADVLARDAEGVGLYACAGAASWYLFQWSRGSPVGTWHLMRMADGRPASLGMVSGDLDQDSPHRLSLSVANGLIDCRVDGRPVIVVADFALPTGAAGLRADGGQGVTFSNVMVRAVDEPYHPVDITAQFAKEETMADWARPASDWPRDFQTGAYCFRLPLFNDVSVRVPFRMAAGGGGRVALRIGSVSSGDAYVPAGAPLYTPGLEVEYLGSLGGKPAVTCRRGGLVLAQTAAPNEGTEHLLRVDKVGTSLRAWLDDAPVAAANDGTWLDNSGLDVTCEGAAMDRNEIETYSTHMLEYTFSGAPTDWRPKLGLWQVTDRWSCFPGWAWYGGSKHQTPLLWSKRQFYGDQTFEFWAGLEMDTSPQRGGYTHPSDINCTIAGDGQNLCSGYSFVFAGDNNTVTKILRGNAVVAQTTDARFVNPNTGNMDFHRHWFHVKAVKLGPELYMAVDGRWVLRWTDPQPIAGGHVAVWSYNNGILIARARATAQVVR